MTNTYMEPNTRNTIIIDTEAKQNITKEYHPEKQAYTITISRLTASIFNKLLSKFIETDWEKIALTMKNGDVIEIDCFSQIYENIQKLDHCEFFNINGGPNPYMCSESLTEIAGMIADYDKLVKQNANNETFLRTYYRNNIQGHTYEELRLGNDTVLKLYEADMTDADIDEDWMAANGINVSREELMTALQLSHSWEYYNDLYKSTYGHRPEFVG